MTRIRRAAALPCSRPGHHRHPAGATTRSASTTTAPPSGPLLRDLTALHHLVAVTARSNRGKAGKDPSRWLPPYEPDHWGLAADPAENQTLITSAQQCPNTPLPATVAET